MSPPAPTVVAVIASLRGTVLEAVGSLLVVEVAGVGYAVTVTPEHALAVRHGEVVLLHTAMVVREDDISLFGFPDPRAARRVRPAPRRHRRRPEVRDGRARGHCRPPQIATAVTMRRRRGLPPGVRHRAEDREADRRCRSPASSSPSAPAAPRSPRRAAPTCSSPSSGLGYAERAAQAALDDVLAERPDERQTRRAAARRPRRRSARRRSDERRQARRPSRRRSSPSRARSARSPSASSSASRTCGGSSRCC